MMPALLTTTTGGAQFVGGAGDGCLDGGLVRDVGDDADGPVAGGGQLGRERFESCLVEVARCDVESVGRQAPGNFGADAASCSPDTSAVRCCSVMMKSCFLLLGEADPRPYYWSLSGM